MEEVIHMAPAKYRLSFQILLLFIPTLVFAAIVAFFALKSTPRYAMTTTNTEVLSIESETQETP